MSEAMFQSYLGPIVGGILIGLSASLLLLAHGKVAGISGIVGRLLEAKTEGEERNWRGLFLLGLVAGGLPLMFAAPELIELSPEPSWLLIIIAGLLVGFGTRLGSGCTSGHGVCGLSRFSLRSLVATFTFIATGAATVFAMRLLGGAN